MVMPTETPDATLTLLGIFTLNFTKAGENTLGSKPGNVTNNDVNFRIIILKCKRPECCV